MYLMAEAMTGSTISGRCSYKNSVTLKSGLALMSAGAGVPLNMSGATVRYPARPKLSASLYSWSDNQKPTCPGKGPKELTNSLFSGSWMPKTSVRYRTAVSDLFPVTYRVTAQDMRSTAGPIDHMHAEHCLLLSALTTSLPTVLPECRMAETEAMGRVADTTEATSPSRDTNCAILAMMLNLGEVLLRSSAYDDTGTGGKQDVGEASL